MIKIDEVMMMTRFSHRSKDPKERERRVIPLMKSTNKFTSLGPERAKANTRAFQACPLEHVHASDPKDRFLFPDVEVPASKSWAS